VGKVLAILFLIAAISLSACSSAFIDKDAVEDSLIAHKSEFNSCYEDGTNSLASRPSGRVRVNFVIGREGKSSQVFIEETTLHVPLVESCMVKAIEKIQFPPSQGEDAHISYPFKFHSQ
jgi:TonB family protein